MAFREFHVLSANRTTMWWKGKAHPLKEPDVFCNIVENLFLNGHENDAKG